MAGLIQGFQGLVIGEVAADCKDVVVGVDFGTAYSGIAYAYKQDPGTIYVRAPNVTGVQSKTPTALLKLPDNTWLFGNDAETKYNELLLDESVDGREAGQLFKGFKMVLKDKETGTDLLMAFSAKGQSHQLLDLVTQSLKFLKECAVYDIRIGHGGNGVADDMTCIQWVLTIPAIWNNFGKAFMRKAAFQAGMILTEQSDNLMFALEPEGASIAVHIGAMNHNLLSAGNKYWSYLRPIMKLLI